MKFMNIIISTLDDMKIESNDACLKKYLLTLKMIHNSRLFCRGTIEKLSGEVDQDRSCLQIGPCPVVAEMSKTLDLLSYDRTSALPTKLGGRLVLSRSSEDQV